MENKKKYSNLTEEQMKIVHQYCDNNMQKLKQVCYPIIVKIGGISQKDYDDLHSLAQVVFLDSLLNYDEKKCRFHPFLITSLKKRLYSTYIRDRNRKKRCVIRKDNNGNDIFITNISLDASFMSISNNPKQKKFLVSGIDVHEEIFGEEVNEDIKLQKYLNNLSQQQKKIAELIMEGCLPEEIQEILHITKQEFLDQKKALGAYRNISILFK